MSDRELLEWAAKAAGPEIQNRDGHWIRVIKSDGEMFLFTSWNPLTDDGDAFQLMVKLGLGVSAKKKIAAAVYAANAYTCETFTHKDDPYAATRRAIVRAAAEIGKAMP